jgi:YjjG family noncanonical pyrimidine nucleotidase
MIDTLLIDLDDTILDFTAAEATSLKGVLIKYGIPVNEENVRLYENINRAYWERLEKKEVTRAYLLEQRFDDYFALFGKKINSKEVNDYYFSFLGQCGDVIDGSEEFLIKAKAQGFKIYIVSNGSKRVQYSRIEKSGLKKYFDQIYLSELINYAKPDINFFYALEKDTPNLKKRAVMIGDSLTSDIQGGINYGIPTIWFNPKQKISSLPNYSITRLDEVFTIIEQLNEKN